MPSPAEWVPEAADATKADEVRARVETFRRKHRTGLVALLFTDLVGSTLLKQQRGDSEGVALMQAHAKLVRDVLGPFREAEEISTSGDSFFCAFVKPSDAVAFAVRLQAAMRAQFGAVGLSLRLGVPLGEVVIEERPGEAKPRDLFGLQVDTAARVMSLAEGGQILCTRSVFDNARQVLKGRDFVGAHPSGAKIEDGSPRRGEKTIAGGEAPGFPVRPQSSPEGATEPLHTPGASVAPSGLASTAVDGPGVSPPAISSAPLRGATQAPDTLFAPYGPHPRPLIWLNHGPYVMKGVEDPVEVCEVGEEEVGVLKAPPPSEKAHPAGMSEEELGWRPSHDAKVPGTDWVLDARLGEGAFGEVWRARHRHTKEVRVFKFCFLKERARTLKRELALFRLIREQIGEHKNIVRLHEVHLDEAPYYLGIEYVNGRNLREWLNGSGHGAESVSSVSSVVAPRPSSLVPLHSLSIRAKLDIAAQVADALAAAHKAGVIHQDVKPQNILVDESAPPLPSGAPHIKLTDFGVGRVIDVEVLSKITMTLGGLTMIPTTKSGSESGSLLYMAPERLEGKGATPQSDLYSLGVVLFQMIVGDLDRAITIDWRGDIREIPRPWWLPFELSKLSSVHSDLERLLTSRPDSRIACSAEAAKILRRGAFSRGFHMAGGGRTGVEYTFHLLVGFFYGASAAFLLERAIASVLPGRVSEFRDYGFIISAMLGGGLLMIRMWWPQRRKRT